MKKKVKSLIVAASVAAIAGIGAVSFAAWTNGNDKTVNVNNSTLGTVTLFGFDSEGDAPTAFKDLYPSDQWTDGDATTHLGNMRKEMTLPAVVVSDATAYKITVTGTPTAAPGNTLSAGLTLHVIVQAADATEPALESTAWKTVGKETGAEFEFTTQENLKAYFKLTSEEVSDMGASYNITFTAEATA